MNNKQIEKAADEYVMLHFIDDSNVVLNDPFPEAQATYKRAFIAGAQYALSHQWISVEERLPKPHEEVLTYRINAIDENAVAYHDGEDWYTIDGEHIRPHFWLPIPPLKGDEA